MSNPLQAEITSFVQANSCVTGVILSDLDGTHIALHPHEKSETLCNCAVFTGVALRRASTAEKKIGRAPIDEISLDGEIGALLALRVAHDYQVVAVMEETTPASRVREASLNLARRLTGLIDQSPMARTERPKL